MVEMSEEMKEALRILREDKIIENTAKAREHNEALLARLDKRDAEDAQRWAKFDEATRKPAEPPTPENDPEPVPGVPPAPPPAPEPAVKAKRKGLWFREDDDAND